MYGWKLIELDHTNARVTELAFDCLSDGHNCTMKPMKLQISICLVLLLSPHGMRRHVVYFGKKVLTFFSYVVWPPSAMKFGTMTAIGPQQVSSDFGQLWSESGYLAHFLLEKNLVLLVVWSIDTPYSPNFVNFDLLSLPVGVNISKVL